MSLLQRLELSGTPWEEEEAFLQDPYYNNEPRRVAEEECLPITTNTKKRR